TRRPIPRTGAVEGGRSSPTPAGHWFILAIHAAHSTANAVRRGVMAKEALAAQRRGDRIGAAPQVRPDQSPVEAAAKTVSARARCLQDLATDVRNRTIQLLQAARPAELTWTPRGTSNHILWHAGHALWLQDVLCTRLITGSSELPPGWDEMFRMGSRPA